MKISIILVMSSIILQTFLFETGEALKCYACDEGRPGAKKDVKCDNKIVVDCGSKEAVACLRQFPNPYLLEPGETGHVIKRCGSLKDKTKDYSQEEAYDEELGHHALRRYCTTDLCNK